MVFKIKDVGSHYDSISVQGTDNVIARVAIAEDGQVVYANDSFCVLSQMSYKDVSSTNMFSLLRFQKGRKLSKAAFQKIESGVHSVFIDGIDHAFSFHFDWLETPDGRRFLIGCENDERSLIIDDSLPQSEMQAFEAQLQRITAKNADVDYEHLIEDQDDLRRFLNMSHDVMVVADAGGQIEQVNRSFYDVMGYGDQDIEGMTLLDLFYSCDHEHVSRYMDELCGQKRSRQHKVIDFEVRMPTKFGDARWIEWRQKMRGEKLYCVGRDVTDIKRHENALFRREKQLEQAEAIGRMGHWSWRVGDNNLDWSEEIFRIFGVDRGSFCPSIDKLTQVVHRRDVGKVLQALQHALIQENDYDVEFRIKQPSGSIRFIRCEGRCQKDESGDVVGLYGIMQDMTERILYERNLRDAKESAERAYAAKSQFLANMSHELRTPLNAIIGFSEMMQREMLGPIGTPQYMEYIGGIRDSGEHLLDLISDILDMSKIEAGKYELDLEEVTVAKVMEGAGHMMENRAHGDGISLSVKLPKSKDLKIVADRRAFLQVLLNLMSNAVKFTEEGGSVAVVCYERKEFMMIKVSDTGIGIPPNKLQSITNPFEQVSSSYARDHEGSGLGLAITKELVEMHGGALMIDSKQGVGTTVSVRFPYDASKVVS